MTRRKIKANAPKSRKDDLNPDKDKFITETMSILEWTYSRRRPIALVLGFALIAALLGIGLDHVQEGARARKSEVLAEGLEVATAPVVPPKDDSAALPRETEDDKVMFETEKARATESLKKFEIATEETDSSIALLSQLGLATSYANLGEYDKAIELYEKILSSGDSALSFIKPNAVEGLGYALEASGKNKEAKARFDDLIKSQQGTAAAMAKYQVARLSIADGNTEDAEKLLQEIVNTYQEQNQVGRLNFLFVKARQQLLQINPDADVPDMPTGGQAIDPNLLKQMMQNRAGGGVR
ncbi:MAG: tetratricopeptide repeat protein [Proteobacteria bacterium]|nr:tetratricopeptide repeat protein [Pseudomonadota bacterium]